VGEDPDPKRTPRGGPSKAKWQKRLALSDRVRKEEEENSSSPSRGGLFEKRLKKKTMKHHLEKTHCKRHLVTDAPSQT